MITASEEFLSPQEVGDRLGASVYTVRRWIKAGDLPAFKPGKEYRVRQSDLEEFLRAREVRPKAPPRSPYEPSLLNGLEEARGGEWSVAVHRAQQLQETGRARMEELLASWRESKERGEPSDARREYRTRMGELLQRAYDTETALVQALSGPQIADQWPEVQKADRFYVELWHLVQGGGLSIRTEGSLQQEGAQQEQLESHTVEERSAA